MNNWILLPVFLPILSGAVLLWRSFRSHLQQEGGKDQWKDLNEEEKKKLHTFVGAVLLITAALALAAAWSGERESILFYLMKDIPIYFHIDAVGRLFVTFVSVVWVAVGFYSFGYMKHEGEERRFFGFYLVIYGVLIALDFAGNLVTMYFFYEFMTLCSMPLVLHNGSKEAIMAALKYLFYSMCGAYLGLFGIFFLYRYCDTLTFTPGGTLNLAAISGHEGLLLAAVFAMLIGFGAKAGMFPLHAWLPAAHPVAPSPASAALSGIIVKSGVLAVIRVVYYVAGADFLRGTWVQTAWMTLALITVFMGSLLAFREPVLKKRLAYSTVSQVSYILFGLALLQEEALGGALLHTVFHAFIKCALFLTAGSIIYRTGMTKVKEMRGIGKIMPATLWCYTIASLALIGIPPMSGFISKWYLAQGALSAPVSFFRYLGPAVLLISALLTAGYLLPLTIDGFLPGKGCFTMFSAESSSETNHVKTEAPRCMLIPLAVLAGLSLVLGLFPNPLIEYVMNVASSLL